MCRQAPFPRCGTLRMHVHRDKVVLIDRRFCSFALPFLAFNRRRRLHTGMIFVVAFSSTLDVAAIEIGEWRRTTRGCRAWSFLLGYPFHVDYHMMSAIRMYVLKQDSV